MESALRGLPEEVLLCIQFIAIANRVRCDTTRQHDSPLTGQLYTLEIHY